MDIKVSVIIPVYNVEKYISDCIKSVLNQTYKNIEVLLIDDGSTDNSGKLCDKFAKDDCRITVFHQKNSGVSCARNFALDRMKGDYCILVDSDDIIHPQLIEKSLELAKSNNLDVVIYKYKIFDSEKINDDLNQCIKNTSKLSLLSHDEALKEILLGKKFRMLAWNKLYKSSLWNNIRFPEGRKFGDDTSVTYRLIDRCERIGYTENNYYFYRMHNESALHKPISEYNLQLFDAYEELLDYMEKTNPNLCDLAYYAYVVRIFDFCAKLKLENSKSKYLTLVRKLNKITTHKS